MTEYIDKEIALSLVQPDASEDETGAVTIATAKKLVRSIIYRTPTADVAPVVNGRIEAVPVLRWRGFTEPRLRRDWGILRSMYKMRVRSH